MRCPACGNEVYKRIDYVLVQCTQCGALWDAQMYPGFPVPKVEPLAIWDTSETIEDDFTDGDDDPDDEFDDIGDEKEEYRDNDIRCIDGEEENADTEDEFDDWGGEDENEQMDDNFGSDGCGFESAENHGV